MNNPGKLERMWKTPYFFQVPLLIVFAFLLSFTYLFYSQIAEFTILSHEPDIKITSIFPSFFLFSLFLLGLWMGYSRKSARLFGLDRRISLHQDFITYIPLIFLALLPLLLSHYLDSDDLHTRVNIFLGSVLLSIFYLKVAVLYSLREEKLFLLKHFGKKIFSLSLKKKLGILFITSLVLYNTGSIILTSSGQTFAGDEPHYLLISHSLLRDGDIDLSNNYANKDYQKIMLAQVKIKSHTAPGTQNRYSFHSPGTSLFLLPFYALGFLFKGKLLVLFIRLGMSVFGALLGLQIYLFATQEWKQEKLAVGIWFLYSFSSPVFFYSLHVYPEIIIALFSLAVFRLLRFSSSLSRAKLVFIGLLLSGFIWFHAIKYVFIAVPLLIYSVWALLKKHKVGWNILYFLIFPSILTSLYFLFQHTFYGSLSLSSVSWRGAMAPEESLEYLKNIVTGIPFRHRWETLAGFFFDQRDGLLLYAPIYFFAFLGCVEILRRNFRYLLLLLFLTVPYVLNSAFLTQRTGYAPQARPLVAVSWVLAILVGYFLVFNAKKIFSIIFCIFAFLGFCFVFILLKNPLALYQLTTAGTSERSGLLFLLLSNLQFFFPRYLSSYIKIDNTGWIPNYAWIGGTLLFVALYIAVRKHRFRMKMPFHLGIASIGILIIFIWLVLYPRTVLLYPTNTKFPSGEKITFFALGRVAQMVEPGKFHLPRDNRAYIFHFTSWRKIKEFHIDFGSLDGEFDVNVRFFDLVLFKGEISHKFKTLRLPSPSSYPFKNTNLYRLSIHLKRKSGVIAFAKPFLFSIQPITE
jgi:hypothetical protein